jgi:hypothetical protein
VPDPEPAELLIWWTTAREASEAELAVLDAAGVPEYVRAELRARTGRCGRGRLWIPEALADAFAAALAAPLHSPAAWARPLGRLIAHEQSGGIVFRRADLPFVARLPGFVTDGRLDLVTAPE